MIFFSNFMKKISYLKKFNTGILPRFIYLENKSINFNSLLTRMSFSNEAPYINGKSRKTSSAGIIIIGDEILKGQTQDVNTYFITQQLYKLGIKVQKVSVIPDDLQVISEEVKYFSKNYTHVITSGGIGPTHDDITFEGVAAAFEEKLLPHPVIVKLVEEWFHTSDLSSPPMKMAHIPESAVLHFGEDKELGVKSVYPTITVKNVVIFPGIPHLLRKAFKLLSKKLFPNESGGFCHSKMFFSCDEVSLAVKLNQTVDKFPGVVFGSYPELFHSYYKTKITLESTNEDELVNAENYLKSLVNQDDVVNYVIDTISNPGVHLKLLDSEVLTLFSEARKVIEECFTKYSPEEVCLCYNGGKDCLVALHITYVVMAKIYPDKKLQALYIKEQKGFPQVHEFVNQSIVRYNLDCEIINGPMKKALFSLLNIRPSIKAVIMGTRRVDPHGESLDLYSPTDGDWPKMMRVNPIIDWNYGSVWKFIRQLFLPYCSLYDKGYTSLGSVDNTLPNPSLEKKDPIGRTIFLPAFQLQDFSLERKGRI